VCALCGYLRKENRCAMATSEKKQFFACRKNRNLALRSVLFSQVPKKGTDLDLSLLYILTLKTYSKIARNNNFLALGVSFRSPARALSAGLPRQHHVQRSTDESIRLHNKNSMKCVVNWIPLRIRVRSRNT